jgi:predicted membrane-bound spermidine synthase
MQKNRYIIIALLSVSLISLEIIWTRIFSAEFFYTFAFLTLSLAVMGLGLGALALRLFPFLDKPKCFGIVLSLTGLMALAGPPVVFQLGLRFSQLFTSWLMVGKFVLTIFLLSSAFFFGGIALAKLFKRNHQDMPRLYMSDLLGAGVGVLVSILFMNWFGTPLATFLCTIPLLLAAFIASERWLKVIPVGLTAAAIVLGLFSVSLLEMKREERAPVIYKHWDAMSKLKIYEVQEDYYGLNIDNVANSGVYGFDGNWDRPDSLKFEFGIKVKWLIQQFDSCTFLSLGAGGGVDVLQALQEGATEIHAVEVNPHINDLLLNGMLAEFSGNIYHDPRVKVVTEDVRTYIKRHKNKFDMIYSLSSNTWAALASGTFALAENYLFTTEAFEDYWLALSDSGFMMMEHQFYMPRLVSEVIDALENQGVDVPEEHFAIYDLPQMRRNMILLSKRPLTDSIRYNAFFELTEENYEYIHLLYPAPDSTADNLINQIVLNGWRSEADSAIINLSPCTDDRPFVAQMGLWKNLEWDKLERVLPYEFMGFPLVTVLVLIILIVIVALIIPLNLIPFFTKRGGLKAVPWLYFFVIGMAFMIVEIILIHKYTLFIGPSVYSIIAILLTLLIGSGIGSRFARGIKSPIAFLGIVLWLILDVTLFPQITSALSHLTMLPRILTTILLVFPLGFFMGIPFPKGTLRVGELIDWGFAVNGVASVLGSVLIMLIAFTYGFTISLLIGAGLYLLAFVLISAKRAW